VLRLSCLTLVASFLIACGSAGSGPQIQSVGPATIVPGKSALVIINGQGFKDGASVTFGGQVQALKSVWVNASTMTAVPPNDMKPAQYSVEVTNPDGQRAISRTRVNVSLAPTSTPVATPERKATIYPPTRTATPTPSPSATPTPTATMTPTPRPTPTQILEPPRIITPTPRAPEIIPPPGNPAPAGAQQPDELPRPSDPFRR
jgi:hypothetical protein